MKIAFLGLRQAFDYFQIGGTESFVRRIATQMVKEGNEIDYILYGDKENKEIEVIPGLILRYFITFEDALETLSEKYEHIIIIYLLPKNRLKYATFRKQKKNKTKFHFVYFSWPDSLIKRKLYFSEARLFPYNGKLFCISKRQYEYVSKWADNAIYLLPPVPGNYFLTPEEKQKNEKIKVTFLGRIDPGKGIRKVIDIFKTLKGGDKYECCIYGIHIPEDKQSLEIRNWLRKQKDIKYIEVDRQRYSPSVDDYVRCVLKETDIFIQPYQRLSSTIDTPLLLLEAMASLCAVLTKPYGNIPDIYGKSKFLISPERFVQDTIKLLKGISYDELLTERNRIYEQNLRLNFNSENIAEIFLENINKGK
ncbi:MAG: glycosyltransferase [bacterium]|nr:glycosyltransferase [bacterium]